MIELDQPIANPGYGSGFSTTRSTTAKIEALAPIASASVNTAVTRERRAPQQPPRRVP